MSIDNIDFLKTTVKIPLQTNSQANHTIKA